MKKRLIILSIFLLVGLNLTATDIVSIYSRWEAASGAQRVRIGNELLAKGYEEDLISDLRSYHVNQVIESEARIYDMMSYYYYVNDQFDDALSTALMALPLCEKCSDDE